MGSPGFKRSSTWISFADALWLSAAEALTPQIPTKANRTAIAMQCLIVMAPHFFDINVNVQS
ncbi:MAG TPA: hypothetical protein VL242_05390 [Sorangium sp.]|nr:hypothetical protein [Sorangium sp.]